jgi:hypothetical protein
MIIRSYEQDRQTITDESDGLLNRPKCFDVCQTGLTMVIRSYSVTISTRVLTTGASDPMNMMIVGPLGFGSTLSREQLERFRE